MPPKRRSYELGYRAEPSRRLNVDLALFSNDYENLIVESPLSGITIAFNNSGEERSIPLARTSISGSWSTIHLHRSDRTPLHLWQLRAGIDLTDTLQLDAGVYYRGRRVLEDLRAMSMDRIGSHIRTDLRLAWKPRQNVTLALVAQDLFDRQHRENNFDGLAPTTEIERSVFFEAALQF